MKIHTLRMNELKYCTNLGTKYCSTWEQILVKIVKGNTKDKWVVKIKMGMVQSVRFQVKLMLRFILVLSPKSTLRASQELRA